jgi:hypothetical protein
MDVALISGAIPKNIPYIKQAAMEALKDPYPDKNTANTSIRENILTFYSKEHPDVFKNEEKAVRNAIVKIQGEYALNSFPYMRADATKYLNHIGHLESEGCFRCHNDRHKTAKGETISMDCNLCHTIIAQGPTGKIVNASVNSTLEFVHPTDIGNKWKTAICSECHQSLYD